MMVGGWDIVSIEVVLSEYFDFDVYFVLYG